MSSGVSPSSRTKTAKNTETQWSHEIDDLIRGISGGFLFGTPLLFTMEVWWIGSTTPPIRMIAAIVVSYIIVFMLNRTAGFRRTHNIRFIDAAIDSVDALALGLLCSASVLVLLREITTDTSLNETIGKIVYESVPFSIGVALASQFLHKGEEDEERVDNNKSRLSNNDRMNATLADVGATIIGAIVIAFNIAPTDEVAMLSAAITSPWLITMIIVSIVISYAIVFEAGFADEQQRKQQKGICQHPYSETLLSYLVALVAAAFMLWFFQRLDFSDPWQMWLSHTIILGLPAAIGGAAGRLAV
jgi:putative integral membrane protein (TIGR02587 family)